MIMRVTPDRSGKVSAQTIKRPVQTKVLVVDDEAVECLFSRPLWRRCWRNKDWMLSGKIDRIESE